MERQFIRVTIEDRVAMVTIDHPPANALNTQTVTELNDAIDELAANAAVKVIIITGGGAAASSLNIFVAGADIGEIQSGLGQLDMLKTAVLSGQGVLSKIEKLSKPVICAVNGVCLGGGNELAMACHIRIAGDNARFGQPEINLGIIPGFGGTQRLPRIVGKGKALEVILTGDMINAQEAYRLGLVNKVVPATDVIKTAKDLARKLSAKSAVAMAAAIKAVNEGLETDLDSGLAIEADHFVANARSDDAKEGVGAFIQKRPPKFQDK
jgi:enoyl-CoA hydratase/carnithine racemase